MEDNWKGVRPLRFKEEVFEIIHTVVDKSQGATVEELRDCLLRLRVAREERRMKALQKSVSLENIKRKRPILLTKTEQMIRVLRRTGLIVRDGDVIRSTSLSRQLISIVKKDEIRADAFFIERLVNSPFRTYWMYLNELFNRKRISIPRSLSERDARLKKHVILQGFPLDMWSFFILRDLFYDFSLLNYVVDDISQRIFPLYVISHKTQSHLYVYGIRVPGACLSFWPKMPTDFPKRLAEVYLSITGNRWNRMVDLILLREKYSLQFETPERQFDILLDQTLKQKTPYEIVLSVGQLDVSSQSTYITKALSLPYNKSGFPYTLMRMGIGGS